MLPRRVKVVVNIPLRRVRLWLVVWTLLTTVTVTWSGVPDTSEPFYNAFRALSFLLLMLGMHFLASKEERLRVYVGVPAPPPPAWALIDGWFYLTLIAMVLADTLYLGIVLGPTIASCPAVPQCDAPGELFRYGVTLFLHSLLLLNELLLLVYALIAGRVFITQPNNNSSSITAATTTTNTPTAYPLAGKLPPRNDPLPVRLFSAAPGRLPLIPSPTRSQQQYTWQRSLDALPT